MLFAVEGGGFFSSSASGYSKALTLLLLGQKKEEKSVRVSPWNHYQLVDQETDPDIQLASLKNRLVRGCSFIVCLGRTSAELEAPSPLKVGRSQQRDILPVPAVSDKGKDYIYSPDPVEDAHSRIKVALKSSLKKTTNSILVSDGSGNDCNVLGENLSDVSGLTERRKVQWTDASGGELVSIREFEPSDTGESDDDFENSSERTCSCMIM